MLPHQVDPGWYDAYWWTDRPCPKRRSLTGSLVRFAALVFSAGGRRCGAELFRGAERAKQRAGLGTGMKLCPGPGARYGSSGLSSRAH